MTLLQWVAYPVILLFIFALTTAGQEVQERLCTDINVFVIQPLKPLRITKHEVYLDECLFRFAVDNSDSAYVSVEKHKTKKEAREALKDSLDAFTAFDDFEAPPKHRPVGISANGFWDEAFAFESRYPDNFILLRKGVFEITLISSDYKILVEIEKKLRGVRF